VGARPAPPTWETFISPDKNNPVHYSLKKLLSKIQQEVYRKEDGFHLAVKANLYETALFFLHKIPRAQLLSQTPGQCCNNHRTFGQGRWG
jgi:hypothetical protein